VWRYCNGIVELVDRTDESEDSCRLYLSPGCPTKHDNWDTPSILIQYVYDDQMHGVLKGGLFFSK